MGMRIESSFVLGRGPSVRPVLASTPHQSKLYYLLRKETPHARYSRRPDDASLRHYQVIQRPCTNGVPPTYRGLRSGALERRCYMGAL